MATMQALVLSSAENKQIVPIVRKALADAGIRPIDLNDLIVPGALWASAISDAIHEADLIVVELSDQNPNIMYELGIAHALRKPTLILASRDSRSKIPSDLAGVAYLLYNSDNPSELAHEFQRWIPSLSARRGE